MTRVTGGTQHGDVHIDSGYLQLSRTEINGISSCAETQPQKISLTNPRWRVTIVGCWLLPPIVHHYYQPLVSTPTIVMVSQTFWPTIVIHWYHYQCQHPLVIITISTYQLQCHPSPKLTSKVATTWRKRCCSFFFSWSFRNEEWSNRHCSADQDDGS